MARLRPALLVAGALAVTGATAASPETTALTVSVRPGTPTPDPEDSNRLGRRGWDVPFEITVSGAPCSEPDVRYAYRILFNRRTTDTYAADAEATARPGMFSASAGVQLPGSVVWFTATARCSPGDVPVAAEARVRVPPRTCDAGPIPVRALRGRAMREDFNRINRLVPLAKGDLVVTAYDFRVASGARLVLGEPACNGLLPRRVR
jgi:hypothetical protein